MHSLETSDDIEFRKAFAKRKIDEFIASNDLSTVCDLEEDRIWIDRYAILSESDQFVYIEADSRLNLDEKQVQGLLDSNLKALRHYARKVILGTKEFS